MELIQGKTYNLKVIKEECDRKKFKVRFEDGSEYYLNKFKFQYDLPEPDEILCYVKQLVPSIVLSQDMSVHINNFYEIGGEYEFTVSGSKNDPELQYDLKDSHGLCFKLLNPSLNLSKGDRVKCKITKIKDANVSLKYVGTLTPVFPLEFYDVKKWLEVLNINGKPQIYLDWLDSMPEFEPVMVKYRENNPTWILDALQIANVRIPQWLIDYKDNLPMLRNINRRLQLTRKLALYILEGSDYLKNCNSEQRSTLQSKLSNYVKLYEQLSVATSKILDNTHEIYINRLFNNLKNAGYLYEPARQITIMMTILKLRPELINSRMGELFETLHNWDLSNWQSEPFREALLEQLQIFIEEHYGKVNLLASNDTGSDNKVISRLILALAIQRLLATDKDDIDLNLNRSLLYRYTSYLLHSAVNVLLQKSIESLLGEERADEFNWEDTNKPTLLFNKIASLNLKEENGEEDIIKTYSTSKGDIQLQKNKLHIIAKGADMNLTVIPNNIFDWLSPTVSLQDELTSNLAKKNIQLKDYRNLWSEIRWSIFGTEKEDVVHVEKKLPTTEEELNVIIDDFRILTEGHEKQRLQFHCIIKDDFFYGDGWMPCDAIHMVGWMNENNFDGSLRAFQDSKGNPLLFKAQVHNYKGDLKFSIKETIENYLLDSNVTGQESVALVSNIDKVNNGWICLSENGASYKLAYDSTTSELKSGNIIRITYYEHDKSNQTSQFFIGTLSPDQENLPVTFNKNDAFCNLLNAIGDSWVEEEDQQVLESEQVMTREELLELIYIIRRRAYSEQEYVKAYNYLGLASILVRFIEEDNLLNELTVHMDLLELLHDFAKNRKVDMEVLEGLRNRLIHSPMLERLYTRLRIVADMDVNENAEWLWSIQQNPRNETEGTLAALVLSYNLLPKEMETSRKQIINQIANLMNINNPTVESKYYGDECQTIEFKSSLVYTPNSSKAAIKDQLREITQIICGFMNARGGKLFIGVNDWGYENGLEDDLAYRRRHGKKDTIDAMINDLELHLLHTLPSHAKGYWETYPDPESKKGVIVVEVKPVRLPVELDETIYVRSSNVTLPRLGAEREEFILNRPENYDNLLKLWGNTVSEEIVNNRQSASVKEEITLNNEENEEVTDNLTPEPNVEKNKIDDNSGDNSSVSDSYKVKTGNHKLNILHPHQEFYIEPAYYIYFNKDNSFCISPQDRYCEEEPESLLVLTLMHDEANGYLAVTYEDETIEILSIEELINKPLNQLQELDSNKKIKIINIARKEDYLISIIKGNNGQLFYRIDKIESLYDRNLEENKSKIKLISSPYNILMQDIVIDSKLPLFDTESVDADNKTFGVPVSIGDGTLNEEERINVLLKPLQVTE